MKRSACSTGNSEEDSHDSGAGDAASATPVTESVLSCLKRCSTGLPQKSWGWPTQQPGYESDGIEDHRLDGVPSGNETLGSRRNQGVDLLDKNDLVDGARHNAQVVESLDGQRVGMLEHDARASREMGCEEDTSLKTPRYQKKRHMLSHGKYLIFNVFCFAQRF